MGYGARSARGLFFWRFAQPKREFTPVAIYRLEAKIIGRKAKDKAGKPIPGKQVSIVAKAAYRSGEKLKDERVGKTFNYASRSQEVVHREIVTPEGAPDWMQSSRARLWNEVEKAEKRVDSQLAREFTLALPVELGRQDQIGLVRDWCQQEIASQGFVADFAVHRSKDGRNPHAHILATLRPIEGNGFGKKPSTEGKFNRRGSVGKDGKSELIAWRESWAKAENAALAQTGRKERVDHRSLKDRKIDRVPEPKIGVDAVAMQRRGIEADPENVRLARHVRLENQIRGAIADVKQTGEVKQHGAGRTWWERARLAIGRMQERARELLRSEASSWQAYETRRGRQKEPELSR
jgi:ATP-dependent exoDNAse (exonuclease V) alpha subunit